MASERKSDESAPTDVEAKALQWLEKNPQALEHIQLERQINQADQALLAGREQLSEAPGLSLETTPFNLGGILASGNTARNIWNRIGANPLLTSLTSNANLPGGTRMGSLLANRAPQFLGSAVVSMPQFLAVSEGGKRVYDDVDWQELLNTGNLTPDPTGPGAQTAQLLQDRQANLENLPSGLGQLGLLWGGQPARPMQGGQGTTLQTQIGLPSFGAWDADRNMVLPGRQMSLLNIGKQMADLRNSHSPATYAPPGTSVGGAFNLMGK